MDGAPATRSSPWWTSRLASSGPRATDRSIPSSRRLEQLGLVTGEVDRANGRRRKAYELTEAGERALHDWLTSDEPLHIELRHEGALKFFFSDALTPEEQLDQLRRIRETHEDVAAQLRAIEPESEAGKPPAPLMTLEFGIAYQEFLAGWCAEAERRLSRATAKQRS